ncbi:MAG: tetratricopeptide repeat protein [Halieaceae bacterium]
MTSRFEQHKHRYIVRVGGSYLVVGWLLLQVMDITFSRIGLPEWSEKMFMTVIALGFLPALILAWAADIRADRRESVTPADPVPAEPMLDKGLPSIAVLPFTSLSGDSSRDYLADGMTDEVVTLLSQLPDIFIISHNSVLAFRNRDPDVRSIAEELRVRYILQGSTQQIGSRVRVTAQLVEAATGTQIWADKYDGAEESIFEMQDQVSQEIASILGGEIMRKEIQRIDRYTPENLDAWGHYVHAQDFYYRQSQQNLQETVDCAQKAIDKDPKFAQAYSLLAVALSVMIVTRASEDPESDKVRCTRALEKALTLAPDQPRILAECANTNSNLSHEDRAIDLALQAVEKAPCFAGATSILGLTYLTLGDTEQAVQYIKRSQQCSPRDSQMSMWLYWLSWAYTIGGELETALEYANRSIERNPDGFLTWISKTNIEGQLGRLDDAAKSLARAKELLPILSMEVAIAATEDFFATPELAACITVGLAKAGLE